MTAACDGGEPTSAAAVASASASAPSTSQSEAPEEPEPEPAASTLAGPPTDLTPPAPGESRLVGTVVEHLPTGSYHYLRVAPETGEPRWVVTMGGEYHTGAQVEVNSFGAREGFYSRRLDRHFDELVFGMVSVVG